MGDAPDAGADAGEVETDGGAAPLPGGDCESLCKRSYVPCSKACVDSAGEGCAAACESGYKACMRDCFSE